MTTPILEFVDVVKSFGAARPRSRPARHHLTVAPGEFVAVMGPSGCGKSTLLHLAGGLEDPSAGRVLVDGRDLGDLSAEDLAALRRRDVGYVFQRLNLVPSLTAIENVMLPLELDGGGARQARQAAIDALHALGLDASPRPLSRRLLRWAAAAHRHRPRHRRRAPPAARRRADRLARHAQQRPGHRAARRPPGESGRRSCSSPTSRASRRRPIAWSSCATAASSTRRASLPDTPRAGRCAVSLRIALGGAARPARGATPPGRTLLVALLVAVPVMCMTVARAGADQRRRGRLSDGRFDEGPTSSSPSPLTPRDRLAERRPSEGAEVARPFSRQRRDTDRRRRRLRAAGTSPSRIRGANPPSRGRSPPPPTAIAPTPVEVWLSATARRAARRRRRRHGRASAPPRRFPGRSPESAASTPTSRSG